MATSTIPQDANAKLADIKSIVRITSGQYSGIHFNFANGDSLRIIVGKLDNDTNYLQAFVNGVDKGYIKFDVSRNVG